MHFDWLVMTKKAILIVAFLLLAAALGWLYLGATAISTVFGSRHAYRPSPDSDGKVEVILRYSKTPNNPNPSEWKLRLPQQYLESIVGNLKNIGPSNSSYVNIFGKTEVVDAASTRFEPIKDLNQPYVFINLENNAASQKVVHYGGCLSTTSLLKTLQEADLRSCETPNCRIYDQIDGWNVEYSVPRKQALDPMPVCNLLREFLNLYTEHRDNISK
jgi:hypothetical protein